MANTFEQQFGDVFGDFEKPFQTTNSGTTSNKHTQLSLSMCKIFKGFIEAPLPIGKAC